MSSNAIAVLAPVPVAPAPVTGAFRGLPLPWKDPSTVSKADLARFIGALEEACRVDPTSPDLRTCLGIAHAMNYDVYQSMDQLEAAVQLDPVHFFAQFKLAELFYRLRALPRAEEETLKAVNLSSNHWELSMARKQLAEIRRLTREGTQKPEWSKSLKLPALMLAAMVAVLCMLTMVTK